MNDVGFSTREIDTLQVCVTQIQDVASGIRSFTLEALDHKELPPFQAGSHVDVYLPDNVVRQYSLCNSPTDRNYYIIAVKREENGRGGSLAMHKVRVGDQIVIGVPRNNFCLSDSASRHILIAGGIGVTPLLSMYRQLRTSDVPFEFHYSARSEEYAAFLDELKTDPERVATIFSSDPLEVAAYFRDKLSQPPTGSHIYVCGPAPFMDAIIALAERWPSDAIHQERFAATPVSNGGDEPFVVELASTGQAFVVESGQTIVDKLRENGVDINTSCEQGFCGTCLTNVLDGVPDHRDGYLTPEERESNKLITPCVSRCKTARLILDL